MILRRVIKHVKNQEWTAIFIDFFIVVMGIFVGLQVNDWNEVRKERVDEAYYLGRILDDIDESIARNERVIAVLDEKANNAYWVVEKLSSGELNVREQQIFNARFLSIGNWETGDFIGSTLQELQSSGRLGIIKSKAFRAQLGKFELSFARINRTQDNIADYYKKLGLQIWPRFDRSSGKNGNILHTSFEGLAEDVVLQRYLERFAFFYTVRREVVDELQTALEILREQTVSAINGKGENQ